MSAVSSQESASPGRGVTGKGASECWHGLILGPGAGYSGTFSCENSLSCAL